MVWRTHRIPFDVAWGFDEEDPQCANTITQNRFPAVVDVEDIMSLDLGQDEDNAGILEPLPFDASFDLDKHSDTFSDMGDRMSDEMTAVVNNSCWNIRPGWEDDIAEVTETSSNTENSERIEEVIDFGPRGTSNMVTCMRRSEETRMEILAHLRKLPAASVVVTDTNVSHFFKTKTSRERLMTCFAQQKVESKDGS